MNEQANHMSGQEKAIQDFMQNCLVMRKEEQIIDNMLTELGKHYDADSVSVFEVNEASTHISNVRQWYRRGVMPKAGNQQNIALDELKQWLAWFQEQGTFFLSAASGEGNPEACRMLEFHGTDSLMASPILVNEKVAGFVCVDTPRQNTADFLLLSIAASVCYREASSRRREDAKLEKSEKEMTERVNQGLADQKKLYEANENLTTLLAEEKQYTAIIGALSNVYFGLFYIDLEKNTFQELFSVDKIHHTLGAKGDAREALKRMTNALVGDAYQPVMLRFSDFDTIDERLGDEPIIVQEYLSRTGGWVQCAFIPVERDENG
ncbi:MAG: GAF domain-containing protein, partial [Firmicutes bacterium]|nr:GAF domain-containing protein [Bacillota bacterium]